MFRGKNRHTWLIVSRDTSNMVSLDLQKVTTAKARASGELVFIMGRVMEQMTFFNRSADSSIS